MSRSIYIVDDDDDVRASLHALLGTRSNLLIYSYRSGDAFLTAVSELDPGVVLLDIHMPGLSGIDVLKALSDGDELFPTIVLTGQGDIAISVQAMKLGASDFLEKPYDPRILFEAIDIGFARLEQSDAEAARASDARTRVASLSDRETQVLQLMIDGLPSKVIAARLDISSRTIEVHRAHLMTKLGASNLSQTLRIAFAAAFVTP
jgi:two-component system, LuxR family, response regulator FixJ